MKGREVNLAKRVTVVLHPSLPAKEPLWLMVPIDDELLNEISSLVLFKKNGGMISLEVTSTND